MIGSGLPAGVRPTRSRSAAHRHDGQTAPRRPLQPRKRRLREGDRRAAADRRALHPRTSAVVRRVATYCPSILGPSAPVPAPLRSDEDDAMDEENALHQEHELVLVAGYRDLEIARRDFAKLTEEVEHERFLVKGAALLTKDADGKPTVVEIGNHLGLKGAGYGAGIGILVGIFAPADYRGGLARCGCRCAGCGLRKPRDQDRPAARGQSSAGGRERVRWLPWCLPAVWCSPSVTCRARCPSRLSRWTSRR